jgi:hypothetical protein
MKLTPQAVDDLMHKCLFAEGEAHNDAIEVEGIVSKFGFDPKRVTSHSADIGDLLAELPDNFHVSKGGGWSFLNACEDRHGNLWTGEHRTMEHLFCLGIAAGKAQWLLPRDMWSALPGGMPYVSVNLPQ